MKTILLFLLMLSAVSCHVSLKKNSEACEKNSECASKFCNTHKSICSPHKCRNSRTCELAGLGDHFCRQSSSGILGFIKPFLFHSECVPKHGILIRIILINSNSYLYLKAKAKSVRIVESVYRANAYRS